MDENRTVGTENEEPIVDNSNPDHDTDDSVLSRSDTDDTDMDSSDRSEEESTRVPFSGYQGMYEDREITVDEVGEITDIPEVMDSEDDEIDIKTLGKMISTVKETVELMGKMWLDTANAYQITDEINRKIANYNMDHRTPAPPELTEEEKESWDYLNGLDHLTLEEAKDILGENHPCLMETEEDTRKSVKDVFKTFFDYAVQRREYEIIRNQFLIYADNEEIKKIEEYEKRAQETDDPKLKRELEYQVKRYYRYRRLEFLREPLSRKYIDRIKTGLVNSHKATYWLQRSQDKIKVYNINPDFILMLYHFEERELEEKYWKLNNCLLIHFMTLVIYSDTHDISNEERNELRCMFIAINSLWSRRLKDEERIAVMNNIKAFEDQLLDVIEENPEGTETIHGL